MPSPFLITTITILFLNLFCFILFYIDKKRAKKQQQRIAEKKLHWATLCFASPGAWLAMFMLRHKNAKPRFYLVTVGITLLHVAVVYGVYRWWGGKGM